MSQSRYEIFVALAVMCCAYLLFAVAFIHNENEVFFNLSMCFVIGIYGIMAVVLRGPEALVWIRNKIA